jgi:hypothetical protein
MIRLITLATCLALAAPGFALAQDDDARGGLDEDKLLELIEQAVAQGKKGKNKLEVGVVAANRRELAQALKIQRTLDNGVITATFTKTEFTDCLDFIRDVTGMNIVLSKAAKKEFGELEVTLRLKKVKIRNLLNLLLEQADKALRYGVKHGVLWIGLKEEWKTKKILRVIDVSDILHRPPNFPGPKLGLKDGKLTFD